MKKPSEKNEILNDLLGFSEKLSTQKSYYPQLQSKIKELEKERRKYFDLFNNSSDALFITDAVGIIIDVNTQASKGFGYKKEEILGTSILTFLKPENEKSLTTAIKNQYITNLEVCQITKTGEEKYSSINLQKIDYDNDGQLLFICRDITEKKLYEIEITKVKNYIHDIFNSMPSVLIGINCQCKINHWNHIAEEWQNKKIANIKNKNIFTAIPALKDFEKIIQSSVKNRETISNLKFKEMDGEKESIFELTIFPLDKSENGAVIRIDDISEKVNLEKMIIQSEKMLSIGGLAAGMAHEINNPLAGMIQNANVLYNRLLKENIKNINTAKECSIDFSNLKKYIVLRKIDKILQLIIDSGQHAAEIVRSMLNFARKNEIEKRNQSVLDILDETIEIANHDFDMRKRFDFKKIKLIKDYKILSNRVLCNKSQLQQVFFNLLKNSAEAMNASSEDGQDKITIRANRDNNFILIEFIDNGPGIPDNIIKNIFDPFFTTKAPGHGTGLGLFVSYYIITENHGGMIDVERIIPTGTKFSIRLPIDEANN